MDFVDDGAADRVYMGAASGARDETAADSIAADDACSDEQGFAARVAGDFVESNDVAAAGVE